MSIALSSGIRAALTSLQSTSSQAATIQTRLATGKRVNSALDNPGNYFTAVSLQARAQSFSTRIDGLGTAVKTLQAADNGVKGIIKLVETAQSLVRQAQQITATQQNVLKGDAADDDGATDGTQLYTRGAGETDAQVIDKALNKTLEGAGGLNMTAGDDISITAGDKTFKYTHGAATTVRDLVNAINSSGIGATASIVVDGDEAYLQVAAGGLVSLTTETATDAAKLGLGTDDVSTVTGSASAQRTDLQRQFNDIRDQIEKLAKDAGYSGVNLLNGDNLKLSFSEESGSELTISGLTYNALRLGIAKGGPGTGEIDFQDNGDLSGALSAMNNALDTLRTDASKFGANMTVVNLRQEFTKSAISVLKSGADDLVIADQNEEAANLLALQTRQQLSQTALSLANQADQGVLRLF
jgi:flagellin-like hook-associated protein FlgL